MTEFLLRVQVDRPDLGFMAGDVLTVEEAATADQGAIVITVDTGEARVGRYDGTQTVIGRVLTMNRRLLGGVR